ncbi:mucin-5AC [Kryptolebias marmoratus]|uniref:Uncharacterized protein n=1 Tax=Kryptolebias marmoratus TaxID=37003 RepID=A0A3Q2ZXM4_KRYMA|nr:mucin-5AC [Kryptolebias marmoratus]
MMSPGTSRNRNTIRAKREDGAAAEGPRSAHKRADDMRAEMNLVFSVLVLLTGSWQRAAASVSGHGRSSPSPEELPQWTQHPAGWNQTSAEPTTSNTTEETVQSKTLTEAGPKIHFYSPNSTEDTSQHTATDHTHSAAADVLSSTSMAPSTAPLRTSTTEGTTTTSLPTFSSPTVQDRGSKAPTSIARPQSETPPAASTHQTSASGRAPAGPTHREPPSELNVGDEKLKGSQRHSSSPLDPLLAGLLSVFIVTTAVVFIVLFFKFRQRTNHPEFHRLQDLPMDDLMEDTPLSMYTH